MTRSFEQSDPKERLMEAALELFNKKGYAGTSVSEIVQAAGVTKPMLYYYFTNKEGIYHAIITRGFGEFHQVIDKYRNLDKGIPEAIVSLFRDMFDLYMGHQQEARLIDMALYGPPEGAPMPDILSHHKIFHELLIAILQKGIDVGEVEPVDVVDLSFILIGTMIVVMDNQKCPIDITLKGEDLERLTRKVLDRVSITK